MDDSTYVPQQTTPMVQLKLDPSFADDQPVNYGPVVWDVLNQVASNIGGATYLIGMSFFLCVVRYAIRRTFMFLGLSLRDPNNPMIPVVAGLCLFARKSSCD